VPNTTNRKRITTTKTLALLLAILSVSAARSAVSSANDRHISVYSPVATYTLPIVERSGREYIGLLELLEPLGRVSSASQASHWTLRYNAVDAEFISGRTHAKIHGRDFDFPAPFLLENSRGLVPLSSLTTLLPRFLGAPVDFRESAHRLFIGDVRVQLSFQLDAATPPKLAINFTAPVNPTISTEPGKLHLVFKRDPVVSPGSQSISFDNEVITHATYSEINGNAELDVSSNQPLMASFSPDRKTITVSAIPQTNATPPTTATSTTPPPPTTTQAPQTAPSNPVAGNANTTAPAPVRPNRILAVVDPAHGGEERGAALSDKLAEKDVTLGFARLLRHELEIRGFAVAMLRDADTTSTLDQRAAAANTARAAIYIGLHAVSQGTGARVYSALLPVEGPSKGIFHAWNTAQTPALPISRIVASAIVTELQKKQFPARASYASLRPLNNVFMPAIAVELAPGSNGLTDLTSANYQQRAAAAIADAVLSVRDRLGVQQ
jgi:N-acetylmuramoyl-L-alanine amidase